jgi:hypothetical protein
MPFGEAYRRGLPVPQRDKHCLSKLLGCGAAEAFVVCLLVAALFHQLSLALQHTTGNTTPVTVGGCSGKSVFLKDLP